MRRVVFVTVILGLLLTAAGCGRPAAGQATGDPPATGQTTSDRAKIYTAMLLTFLGHQGEGAGAGMPTSAYILDSARSDAGSQAPTGGAPATSPIPADDQAAILGVLRERTGVPVQFVGAESDVIVSPNGCPQVKDGGILITLGALPPNFSKGTNRIEVGITGFVACLGATGLDYVVVRDGAGWAVSGDTGTRWIA
jgi:hypothetical protein